MIEMSVIFTNKNISTAFRPLEYIMDYVIFLFPRSLLLLPAQHPCIFKAQIAASRLNFRVINNMVHLGQKKQKQRFCL